MQLSPPVTVRPSLELRSHCARWFWLKCISRTPYLEKNTLATTSDGLWTNLTQWKSLIASDESHSTFASIHQVQPSISYAHMITSLKARECASPGLWQESRCGMTGEVQIPRVQITPQPARSQAVEERPVRSARPLLCNRRGGNRSSRSAGFAGFGSENLSDLLP